MPDNIRQSIDQQRRVKSGSKAEEVAAQALKAAGFVCVEKIETGWTIIWERKVRPGRSPKILKAFPKKKVSGDLKAIQPGTGKAVHCECKTRQGNLPLSALEEHQIEALDAVVKAGAISILAWVKGGDCKLYFWPPDNFGPGKSLKWEES